MRKTFKQMTRKEREGVLSKVMDTKSGMRKTAKILAKNMPPIWGKSKIKLD
jgi:uncharacterized sporulation protein YeaH/YhbH (DUF444 family)